MKRIIVIFFITLSVIVQAQPTISNNGMFYRSLAQNGLLNGLVSLWEFDETSGTTVFDSHGSNDGTNNGADINQTGILDKCYDFTYTQVDYITIPDADNLSFTDGASGDLPFTISVWFNIESIPSITGLWLINKRDNSSGGDEWQIFYSVGNSTLSATLFDGVNKSNYLVFRSSTNPVSTGNWYNLVVTYDGSETTSGVDMYLNGSLNTLSVRSESGTYSGMTNGNAPVGIGTTIWGPSSNGSFNGLIDQTAIWSRVLTPSEISTLYDLGNGIFYIDFTAYIKKMYDNLIPLQFKPLDIKIPLRIAS